MAQTLQEKARSTFEAARHKFHFSNVEFSKAIQMTNLTVLVCKGKIGALIGKGGNVVKELAKGIGSRVRIVENTKDEKKMVADITGNAQVIGINQIFSPEGKSIKIFVKEQDRRKLGAPVEELEKVIMELAGCRAKIVIQ